MTLSVFRSKWRTFLGSFPRLARLFLPPVDVSRAIQCKMYEGGTWLLPGETPQSIAAAAVALSPRLINACMYINSKETLTANNIRDYNTFHDAVRTHLPFCQFFIEVGLDSLLKNLVTLANVQTLLNSIIATCPCDGLFFDFAGEFMKAGRISDLNALIDLCHSKGRWTGGNFWQAGTITPEIDLVSTDTDGTFKLRKDVMQDALKNYPTKPLLVHNNSNPQNDPNENLCGQPAVLYIEESCIFKCGYTTNQRQAFITQMAQWQTSNPVNVPFRYSYPLAFPNCPTTQVYDANSDPGMITFLQNTMGQYNPRKILPTGILKLG